MILGICNLSIVPVRIVDSDKSEMINQLIYGDIIEILEEKEKWVKIGSWKNTQEAYQLINTTYSKYKLEKSLSSDSLVSLDK